MIRTGDMQWPFRAPEAFHVLSTHVNESQPYLMAIRQ